MKNRIIFKQIKENTNNNLNSTINALYYSYYGHYWFLYANILFKIRVWVSKLVYYCNDERTF